MDDGDVVRGAVGGVEGFGVEREGYAPGTGSYFYRAEDLVGCGVDGEDLVAPASAYVELRRVR